VEVGGKARESVCERASESIFMYVCTQITDVQGVCVCVCVYIYTGYAYNMKLYIM